MQMLKVGVRYGTNLVTMVAQQRGYMAAMAVGGRFVKNEVLKLPKIARIAMLKRIRPQPVGKHPPMFSTEILAAIKALGIEVRPYSIDVNAFWSHVAACSYPRNYAAGSMSEGGVREQKLLEYFVSIDLLNVKSGDVVIDVASEWSIFPNVLRKLSGAAVYRQDLIYPPGVQGDRIGGSAVQMPVPDAFSDSIVLHNAFEHFEGTADTDFILEAWRVLKPGGKLCILPLFISDRHAILTDPLVDRRGIMWDPGTQVIELPWWHNRFGRFYDAAALQHRVLEPASRLGFIPTIYHVVNAKAVHPQAYLYFILTLQKSRADA